MNSDHVKASVACYFRYKRQCPIISFERSIVGYFSNPDVLIVNKDRRIIEVEVKVSTSDFKNDIKKSIWRVRQRSKDYIPYQFYYAIPSKMADKVLPILDKWKSDNLIAGDSGLILVQDKKRIGLEDTYVFRKSPSNKSSKKLTVKQTVKMVYNLGGTMCSSAVQVAKMKKESQELKLENKRLNKLLDKLE